MKKVEKKEKEVKVSGTFISRCLCENPYQDEKYGQGRRVFNKCKGPLKEKTYGRCSNCAKEIEK